MKSSGRSWQQAAELDYDNHPDDEGNQVEYWKRQALERLARQQETCGWLPKWHNDLIESIAIMDEKGRGIPTDSRALWQRDWDRLRHLLLIVCDSIGEAIDRIEGR